jgi:hypothetical protein
MNGSLVRKPRQRQQKCAYGSEADDAQRVIAESWDYLYAERLTPNLVWMAEQLERISVSTVGRRLARVRQDEPRLPWKGPKQANTLMRAIGMSRIPWDEQEPGHFEVNLVHHSGSSALGEFVCIV